MNKKTSPVSSKKTITVVDSLCGSGKTFSLVKSLGHDRYKLKSIVLVSPTRALSDQKASDIRNSHPHLNVKNIHSGTIPLSSKSNVLSEVISVVKSNTPYVLLITQATFNDMVQQVDNSVFNDVDLNIDEIPDIASFITIKNKNDGINKMFPTYSDVDSVVISDYLTKTNGKHSSEFPFYELQTDSKFISDNLKTKCDDYSAINRDMFKFANKKYCDFYSTKESWKKRGENAYTNVFRVIRPEVVECFDQVTIMGAFITKSVLYRSWEGYVNFDTNHNLNLQYTSHNNTKSTRIVSVTTEEINFSKYRINELDLIPEIRDLANQLFNGEKSIMTINRDMNPELASGHAYSTLLKTKCDVINSELIPVKSHGMNNYMNINHAVVLASLKPDTEYKSFLMDVLGMTNNDILYAEALDVYQTICRTSLRDPNNHSTRIFIIPDTNVANLVQQMLGCAHDIIQTPSIEKFLKKKQEKKAESEERKRKKNAQYQADYRKRKKEKEAKNQNVDKTTKTKEEDSSKMNEAKHLASTEFTKELDFEDKNTGDNKKTVSTSLFNYLEKHCEFRSDSKFTENRLLLPTTLKDESKGITRDNVTSFNFLFLDKDKSTLDESKDMTMEDFSSIFKDYDHFLYQTYSGGTNFRVCLRLSRTVAGEPLEIIAQEINDICKDHGFEYKEGIGPFDPTKMHCASKFFLPNAPIGSELLYIRNQPGDSIPVEETINNHFQREYDRLDKLIAELDEELEELDKEEYKSEEERQEELEEEIYRKACKSLMIEMKLPQRIERFESLSDGKGRHRELFLIADDMRQIGMSLEEIRMKLETIRYNGKSDSHKTKKINDIIKSLRKKF